MRLGNGCGTFAEVRRVAGFSVRLALPRRVPRRDTLDYPGSARPVSMDGRASAAVGFQKI